MKVLYSLCRPVLLSFNLLLFWIFSASGYAQSPETMAGAAACGNGAQTSGTWTVPCGVQSITVHVYGAGGGGGGGGGGSNGGVNQTHGGGGGGGGGYTTLTFNVNQGDVFNYRSGRGGCGGSNGSDLSSGNDGNSGGSSSFTGTDASGSAINLTAGGGSGGNRGRTSSTGNGSAGGSGSGGSTNLTGTAGGNGTRGSGAQGGRGGNGVGPDGGNGGASNSASGSNYGGGGNAGADGNGGAGAPGAIIITYTVTAGNTVGPASSSPSICINSPIPNITHTTTMATGIGTPTGLPPGVSATWASNTITISGTPTSAGTFNYTIPLAGGCGTAAATGTINVAANSPQPGAISGPSTVCETSTQTYAVPADPDVVSYTWTYPSGWVGTGITNSEAVTVGTASGNIEVVAVNGCGNSTPQTFAVTVLPVPVQPGTISGLPGLCPGMTETYSVPAVPGADSYVWTLPNGWTGSSTTNSISVTAGTASGAITVTAVNSCGNSLPQTLPVLSLTNPAQPGAIAGTAALCPGETATYTIPSQVDATSYQWTLPAGWSGASTTNTITITAGTSGGDITVMAINPCGNSAVSNPFSITMSTVPPQPGPITSLGIRCPGEKETFSIAPVPGATSYTWTFPSGWFGDNTGTSVTATIGASGTVSVVAQNGCGDSQPASINVNAVQPVAGFLAQPTDIEISSPVVNLIDQSSGGDVVMYFVNGEILQGPNTQYSFTEEGVYEIIQVVLTTSGCADTTFRQVTVRNPVEIFVPNAFSPNDDRLNETFKVYTVGELKEFRFAIYNRWGELMYESQNSYDTWDGYYNGKLSPMGMYVYTVEYRDHLNKYKKKQGSVALVH